MPTWSTTRWSEPWLDKTPDRKTGNYIIRWSHYCEDRQRSISRSLSSGHGSVPQATAFFRGWKLKGGPANELAAVDPAELGANLSVADVLDDYLHNCAGARGPRIETTQRGCLSMVRAALGDAPALGIQPLLDDYLLARAEQVKDGTIRRECKTILAAFRWAAGTRATKPRNRRPILPMTAVPDLELPDDGPPRTHYLKLHEEPVFLAEAKAWHDPRVYIFTQLGLHAGPRAEAICDLTWDRVRWADGLGVIDYRNPELPVTRKRRSRVPMSPNIKAVLQEWWIGQGRPAHGLVVGRLARDAFDRFRKASSYPWASAHILRHTYASLALQSGKTDLWEVANVLADDHKTVDKVYGHHLPEHLTKAVR